jgi:poly-gamma-glutamate capsule biosynthesis protein CapA/YwtB (metallophosphatase superfamily)
LLAGWAEKAGFSLVTGCHPHVPSEGWDPRSPVFRWDSLGNLLFDQPDPRCSGVLLEVRFFSQGTMACRVFPLGNLYRDHFAGEEG